MSSLFAALPKETQDAYKARVAKDKVKAQEERDRVRGLMEQPLPPQEAQKLVCFRCDYFVADISHKFYRSFWCTYVSVLGPGSNAVWNEDSDDNGRGRTTKRRQTEYVGVRIRVSLRLVVVY